MINSLFESIINFILSLASTIVSIILGPIFSLISIFFPNFANYMTDVSTYFNEFLVHGIAFAREVFLNVTGYPRALLYIVVTFFISRVVMRVGLYVFRFVINIYRIIRGSPADSSDKPS